MSVAAGIMTGFGFAGAIFAYLSVKLNDSDDMWSRWLGMLFFVITISLVLYLVWASLQLAENNALTYLSSGIVAFINIIMWLLIIIIVGITVKWWFITGAWVAESYKLFKQGGGMREFMMNKRDKERGGGGMSGP